MRRIVIALGLLPSLAAADSDPLAEKVSRMATVGFSALPSFSPDGASIAFVSNLTGVPQVFVVPTEGGWPVQVTAGDDPVNAALWSPRGDLIAYQVEPGGGLNTQVYVVAPDGIGARRLTSGGKDNNSLGGWTDDGAGLTLASNERDAASFDAYLIDVKSGRKTLVAKIGGNGNLTQVSRDGRRAVLERTRSRGDSDALLVDLANKTDVLFTRHTPPGESYSRVAPDGRTVYLRSNNDRDRMVFTRIRVAADGKPGAPETLAERSDAEVSNFAVSYDGAAAALLWNVAGRSQVVLIDLATGTAAPPLALPDDIIK